MDALKAAIAKKKAENQEVLKDRRWIKRAEREEALSALQPAVIDECPPAKKQATVTASPPKKDQKPVAVDAARQDSNELSSHLSIQAQKLSDLPAEEIIRRLRKLGHPATLFGERDFDRRKRLVQVESEITVEDFQRGANDNTNMLLQIQREEKEAAAAAAKAPMGSGPGEAAARGGPASTSAPADDGRRSSEDGAAEEDPLMRSFREAAERLKEQRRIDSMKLEDKIIYYVQQYMAEWKADLDARPAEAKLTSVGKIAADAYKMTEKAFEGLYARLRARAGIHQEVILGLWMMVEGIQQRNYIRANEIYSKVAIGNATWPIGVTSVGIHERSAREKISYYANQTSQAHIMNDEATRKFLQGMKRLMSAMQRLHPTDPSRSVDFNAVQHEGLGAKAGSEKQLLLTADAQGDTWKAKGLPAAPHYLAKDGAVAIPQTWGNTLRAQEAKLAGPQAKRKP